MFVQKGGSRHEYSHMIEITCPYKAFQSFFTLHRGDISTWFTLLDPHLIQNQHVSRFYCRLASVGILGKEREPGVGKLRWHGSFYTGFKGKIYFVISVPISKKFKKPVTELFWNGDCLLVYSIIKTTSDIDIQSWE